MLSTGLVAIVLWTMQHQQRLDVQMVYAYATACSIWFLTDVMRQKMFPTMHGLAWSRGRKVKLYILLCIVIGFLIGTRTGDWYAGHSTFDLWRINPQKLVGFIILAVSISSAYIVFYYQQNKLEVTQRQATESKLQLLQSQLEPHMLFNTLSNLRALIDIDPTRAQAMLDRLIDYLRATLGASRVTTHALALEFDRLDDYLALMQIRMGDRLRYQMTLPDDLKAAPCPALLLQAVVENAVLHGLEPSAQGGEVRIEAKQTPEHLILTICDTGVGISKVAATTEAGESPTAAHGMALSHSGFGLTQLRERLAALYGQAANVSITSPALGGTLVTIALPLGENKNLNTSCRIHSYVQSPHC